MTENTRSAKAAVAAALVNYHYECMLMHADNIEKYPPEAFDDYNIIHAMYHSFMYHFWSSHD